VFDCRFVLPLPAEGLRPSAYVVRVLRRSFGAEVEPHPLTARELPGHQTSQRPVNKVRWRVLDIIVFRPERQREDLAVFILAAGVHIIQAQKYTVFRLPTEG
jgi:hypothetical protein